MASTILITCPDCRRQLNGPAELQGKRVRCKFARGLVWLREDVALVYAGVSNCMSVSSASAEV